MAQIETREAVERVDEILSVDGIDVAFVGPVDLSFSLGVFPELGHERVRSAVRRVLEACERHDVAPGIFASSPEEAASRVREGFRFISISTDVSALIEHYRAALEKVGVKGVLSNKN